MSQLTATNPVTFTAPVVFQMNCWYRDELDAALDGDRSVEVVALSEKDAIAQIREYFAGYTILTIR